MTVGDGFYLRYYVGHKGKFGHEFMEFEINPSGLLRYANNSKYKNAKMIRKQGTKTEQGQRLLIAKELTKSLVHSIPFSNCTERISTHR